MLRIVRIGTMPAILKAGQIHTLAYKLLLSIKSTAIYHLQKQMKLYCTAIEFLLFRGGSISSLNNFL